MRARSIRALLYTFKQVMMNQFPSAGSIFIYTVISFSLFQDQNSYFFLCYRNQHMYQTYSSLII